MLNRSGITKTTATAPTQILGDVDFQVSVGCIVPTASGVAVGSQKIVKAGTPIKVDPANLQTVATVVSSHDNIDDANAILLHDVDVTSGNANGTALIFGLVNYNRLESDVQAMLKPGDSVAGVFVVAL